MDGIEECRCMASNCSSVAFALLRIFDPLLIFQDLFNLSTTLVRGEPPCWTTLVELLRREDMGDFGGDDEL